jgi:glycosyltransferase involved in cell wall biosynthesis
VDALQKRPRRPAADSSAPGPHAARQASDPALTARVHLLGRLSHERVQDVLRAADFLVLGSHAEGSGYAVIEALACGTTPLVPDIPSFRRITGGGSYGALSPPGDAAAMARALVRWAGLDRDALRRAARAHFERALSFDAGGRELREAYRALVAARSGVHAAGGRL